MKRPALEPVARRAVEWMVTLQSGAASEVDRRSFDAWRAEDPRHAAAWDALDATRQQIRGPLQRGLTPEQVKSFIPSPASPAVGLNRRSFLGAAMGATVLGLGVGAADRVLPLDVFTADLSTRTGSRLGVDLAGGGRLVLNARSGVDVQMGEERSVLRLRTGMLHFESGDGPAREVALRSTLGTVLVRDGACNFSIDGRRCRVDVTRGSVGFASDGDTTLSLDQGDSLIRDVNGVRRFRTDGSAALAWLDGRLVVHDEPLSEVVGMLRGYWPGVLSIEPAIDDLRVTGTYPLEETWRALRSLAMTLPIRIERRAGYWITIGGAI